MSDCKRKNRTSKSSKHPCAKMPTDVFGYLLVRQFSPTHPAGGEIHEIVSAHIYLNFYSVNQQSHKFRRNHRPPRQLLVKEWGTKRGGKSTGGLSGIRESNCCSFTFCLECAGENPCSESGGENTPPPKKAQLIRHTDAHINSFLCWRFTGEPIIRNPMCLP